MNFFQKYFGPSTLVTAAFIGPGTLTVCSISGASFGYSLLWVLLFATISTIVLQEMTARLGLVTQSGLGEAIRGQLTHPVLKLLATLLVFVAIIVGNAAYEAGNISGAALGLSGLVKGSFWPLIIGLVSFVILFIGKFKIIERVLIGLVMIMSIVFLLTALVSEPDYSSILVGLFVPKLSFENQWTTVALIGTTIVPYNLFLHASSVGKKWKKTSQLEGLRKENTVAIVLGGLTSMAIVVTSANTIYGSGVKGITDLADQLAPFLGSWSTHFLAIGLFAAGISSSITAPLAAAYAACGIFGWSPDLKSTKFRTVWIGILFVGTVFSMMGYQPIEVIKIAQVANGILLPIIVCFLLFICNRKQLLGSYVNKPFQNILGMMVIIVSILISFRSLNNVFQFL